jgi:hypothetical protein
MGAGPMSRFGRLTLVVLVGIVGVITAVVDVARNGLSGDSVFFNLAGLVFLAVAGVLVLRVPENRVSWVLGAVSAGFVIIGVGALVPEESIRDVVVGLTLFVVLLPGLGVFVPLWFPTGSPPTPRWRWVAWIAMLGMAGFSLGAMVAIAGEGLDVAADVTCSSPGTCIEIGGLVFILIAVVLAIAALVVRWVRSVGIERLQLRWLSPAFVVFGIGAMAEFGGFQYSLVANVFLPIGALLIPLAIGAAILRYRLYEIDRIVSRTVSYALVVGLLAVVFFAVVTALTTVLPAESDLTVAGSTLAVAALFNPVRRWIQGWVDRRFNRSRYDAEKVMDGFASSLRDRVDPDGVVDGWVGVVSETMQPATAGVWVRDTTAFPRNDFGTVRR